MSELKCWNAGCEAKPVGILREIAGSWRREFSRRWNACPKHNSGDPPGGYAFATFGTDEVIEWALTIPDWTYIARGEEG